VSRLEKALEEALKRKAEVGQDSGGAVNTGGLAADAVDETPAPAEEAGIQGGAGAEAVNPASEATPAEDEALEAAAGEEEEGTHLRTVRTDVFPHLIIDRRDKNLAAAEVYGKIKTRLIRNAEDYPSQRKMIITSTVKREGKSITAINLAISIARSYDHEVLLIDCDLRAPSIHKYLGIESEPGLVQCLREGLDPAEAIVRTDINNLSVLTSGGVVDDPVELLSSAMTRATLDAIDRDDPERFIIIDMPPIMPFADAHSLLPFIGGVVFVVREGIASTTNVMASLDAIGQDKLIGVVYNGAEVTGNPGGYYYYGSERYGG